MRAGSLLLLSPQMQPADRGLCRRMQEQGFSQGLQQWMGSNLVPCEGGMTWAFNLPGARDLYK